jgi:AcrR family transcriptional regulator
VRRLEILDAAEKLLRIHGPAVRVDDIMTEAQAAKGTFFTYFATWDDMLEAVRERTSIKLEAAVADLFEHSALTNWKDVLPRLAATFIDFVIEMGGLHQVLFHSAFTQTRPMPQERKPAARIASILRAGLKAGAYAPVDPDPTAGLIFSAIHETANAIIAGADRERSLAALDLLLHRILFTPDEPSSLDHGER